MVASERTEEFLFARRPLYMEMLDSVAGDPNGFSTKRFLCFIK